jgi:hypothetical protein
MPDDRPLDESSIPAAWRFAERVDAPHLEPWPEVDVQATEFSYRIRSITMPGPWTG